ncbi:GntR family transcriptional regulator [Salipiger sp. H15]|uniref:GntR family transcriptional regulator n=1 Tax=Alloyangia sp. H15 TaxID=3029062 RepID=A0AAU8ANV3_9RHOB
MKETTTLETAAAEASAAATDAAEKQAIEQTIYDRIVDAIIDKQIRPGAHLNEVQIARSFGVPRTRLRRVLERLEAEHVVVFERNRGAFVGLPTVKEALDVFETRRLLEVAVIGLACLRATEADIAVLRAHVQRQREVIETRSNEVNRIGADFHMMLTRLTGNHVLEQTMTGLMRRLSLIQSLYEKSDSICLAHEHEALVEAMARKDVAACVRIITEHCAHIEASLEISERKRQSYFTL